MPTSTSTSMTAAARHVCQEARFLLTSLRQGPPHVARGDLAQNLHDVCETATHLCGHRNNHDPKHNPNNLSMATSGSSPNLAHAFLAVIMDPRAAGPQTLMALRCLWRLLHQNSLQTLEQQQQQQEAATTAAAASLFWEEITLNVLACKYEQTNPSADEAVEMAIADVLSLLLQQQHLIAPNTVLEAFNTVFVTRNTFVHSAALCYHFEDVLAHMVVAVFGQQSQNSTTTTTPALLLEFLVNQLLHTPLVGGDGLDEATREAQLAHDATRVLCLRLVRVVVETIDWSKTVVEDRNVKLDAGGGQDDDSNTPAGGGGSSRPRSLLQLVKDDLCLSLLLTGQAIWSYQDDHRNLDISPGYVSLQVLSDICACFATLWNTLTLRKYLMAQFETIFTGFYTRALVLLRRRRQPSNSLTFNANLVFDNEIEVILESLVDLLRLHDHARSIVDGDGGTLETVFAYYDCQLHRSDVAIGLFTELCRACGGVVNEDGEISLSRSPSIDESGALSQTSETMSQDGQSGDDSPSSPMVRIDHPYRPVPAHLKELCAEALMGSLQRVFRDDKASAETLAQRKSRKRTVLLRHVDEEHEPTGHALRDIKSKKRLMRKAARLFNKKAANGLNFLRDSGMVPDPITPASVAAFLRSGLVIGLDKKAIGAYLGEAGKTAKAGSSPPTFERDWFHRDVLKSYCKLFRFEDQSLLDSLRMFLAAFRLPGEAQQIDRILQAFADTCSQVCEEAFSGRLKLFSVDPKRASDAAYLLSFSIIMLNTDRHNASIREDRKMSVDDFVKNNTDYGRDITDKGKEFPREYLVSIYESINEEEIRTEGEGADGAMTVERWRLVTDDGDSMQDELPTSHDAEDLVEILVESIWKMTMSAIGAFWGVSPSIPTEIHPSSAADITSGMLSVQGARLGMDLALEMLHGTKRLGRLDVLQKQFTWVLDFTRLLGAFAGDDVEKSWNFTNSVEAQGALIVSIRMAAEAADCLDEDCWKRLFQIVFQLRDLKLLSKSANSLLQETDEDLLTEQSRRDFLMCLQKGDMEYHTKLRPFTPKVRSSMLGVFGRALFGSETKGTSEFIEDLDGNGPKAPAHVVWNESGLSDDDETNEEAGTELEDSFVQHSSAGAEFQHLIINETSQYSPDLPVTGLERMEDTRKSQISPRARVRTRLAKSCDFQAIVSDSRFLDITTVQRMVKALSELASSVATHASRSAEPSLPPPAPRSGGFEKDISDSSTTSSGIGVIAWQSSMSPASEALAEVLICEIAHNNSRDRQRFKALWTILQDHYFYTLSGMLVKRKEAVAMKKVDPGLEKRVTGLLRLTVCAVHREYLADEVLSSWKYLLPQRPEQLAASPMLYLDKHFGEALWRIAANVDGLSKLSSEGWEGFTGLVRWCALRAGMLPPIPSILAEGSQGLTEDDPALQSYRSIHLLINSDALGPNLPWHIMEAVRSLIAGGDKRAYPQLSIAALDLTRALLERKMAATDNDDTPKQELWSNWRRAVDILAEAGDQLSDSNAKQHALSLLTDLVLEKSASQVPVNVLCHALSSTCVPMSGRLIGRLEEGDRQLASSDEMMIEFELCIGLIFKPFRCHVQTAVEDEDGHALFLGVWKSILGVVETLLVEKKEETMESPNKVGRRTKRTMDDLVVEHLQSAVMMLAANEHFQSDAVSKLTASTIRTIGFPDDTLAKWSQKT